MSLPLPSLALWTLAVQVGTVALIALFFVALAASVRLAEVRVWTLAWAAELTAVLSALGAMFLVSHDVLHRPDPGAPAWALFALYAAAKTAFALLVVRGVQLQAVGGLRRWRGVGRLLAVATGWALFLVVVAPFPAAVLVLLWFTIAGVLLEGARWALAQRLHERSRWLAWLLVGEGLLFGAYGAVMAPILWGGRPMVSWLFDYSSLFDAGGDLLLALAVLVSLESSRSRSLERLNQELEQSHERLRRLIDVDPLTGLANRRALRSTLDTLAPDGEAALLFLDLDGFKRINDRFGHDIGDSALRRVARVLAEHFRPDDGLFRWGGDEFLVVAPGLSPAEAEQRVAMVRRALEGQEGSVPPLALSVGQSRLGPLDRQVEEALREADAAMYADKRSGGSKPAGRRWA